MTPERVCHLDAKGYNRRRSDVYTTRILTQSARARNCGSASYNSSLLAAEAAHAFVTVLATIDGDARRHGRTVPTAHERSAVVQEFWDGLVPMLRLVERGLDESELTTLRADVQAILHPWLLRGRLWNRSIVKPHGYAGDFRTLEWMYDLEDDECADKTVPAAVNLVDELFRSVHSVQAVWHRREWFADLLTEHWFATTAPVRVLDVACGGSRYIQDVIARHGAAAVDPTFVDQDPAALAFIESWLASGGDRRARLICAPVRHLTKSLHVREDRDEAPFDVVISTGLFDYLDREAASDLLAQMSALARPGGTVAISNFSPADESRVVKDWIADWPLIYRDRAQLAELFGAGLKPALSESPDGGLLYARTTT